MGLDDLLVNKLAQAISAAILKQINTPAVAPVLLSCKEAGLYLGRSEQSIQHLIQEGVIPTVRVGRRVHLHRKDLDAWIERNKF